MSEGLMTGLVYVSAVSISVPIIYSAIWFFYIENDYLRRFLSLISVSFGIITFTSLFFYGIYINDYNALMGMTLIFIPLLDVIILGSIAIFILTFFTGEFGWEALSIKKFKFNV
jgi:hypothetical protein